MHKTPQKTHTEAEGSGRGLSTAIFVLFFLYPVELKMDNCLRDLSGKMTDRDEMCVLQLLSCLRVQIYSRYNFPFLQCSGDCRQNADKGKFLSAFQLGGRA